MFNLASIPALSTSWLAASLLEETEESNGALPWWAVWLIIIVIILLFVLLWWWLNRGKKEEAPAEPATRAAELPVVEAKPAVAAAPAPVVPPTPDDLTILEGIGPKINSVLQAAGITTFALLAQTDLGKIEQILLEANLRLADPSTWAEQAKLAAEGKWDELKTLTDGLKGGRKVA